tara:strand:- start:3608 stop:4102 length:495 start_codon:yes stop_codon:yes gene_type:complete
MESSSPKEISDKIIKFSGINIFKNTRKREYVQYRAVLCFLLREKLLMRWTNIANYFQSEGKTMTHATTMYMVRNYHHFKKENKKLDELENIFIFKSNLNYDEIDKLHYLENKYRNLEGKYFKLEDKLKKPLVKLVLDVEDKYENYLIEKIKILKQGSAWQNKSK